MAIHSIRMPDIGEGIAETELVEWHVQVGDLVHEDDMLAAVMTDKATIEIPSSVTGKIVWVCGEAGATIAVGSEFVRIETDGTQFANIVSDQAEKTSHKGEEQLESEPQTVTSEPIKVSEQAVKSQPQSVDEMPFSTSSQKSFENVKVLASPAVRLRARELGVDLRHVPATAPAGRITHADLDAYWAAQQSGCGTTKNRRLSENTQIDEIKVIGLRRKIAERMSLANSHIPHISCVEEIDVTALEQLRNQLNKQADRPKLTFLPFIMRAISDACRKYPVFNAHYDDDQQILRQYHAVHIGIATQTDDGLMVPVIRNAETLNLWESATQIVALSTAARERTASREQLTGSTITITSLGALGGVAFTPIINAPEVAIIGINKMAVRPIWDGANFIPRTMMNLSCSFDHRIIDGYDAVHFINHIKQLLETPALLFMEQ